MLALLYVKFNAYLLDFCKHLEQKVLEQALFILITNCKSPFNGRESSKVIPRRLSKNK